MDTILMDRWHQDKFDINDFKNKENKKFENQKKNETVKAGDIKDIDKIFKEVKNK